MEKRNQLSARSGQQGSDYKKSQDVSSKQFPRQQRRRESFQSENVNINKQQQQQQQQSKNRNNNFYYDKRPQARKNGNGSGVDQQGGAPGEAAGLNEADELNSVFNYGSKKQNLNHLLNFHYYSAKETEDARAGTFSKHGYHNQHRASSKKYNFNKEQYLQANCQFVVKSDLSYNYRPFSVTPDALVEWSQVVKILVSSSEESQCPICLYPPKAAKMTRCGHIFCFACMLHYLSLSDKTWRKCPICYESVHLQDLKSTSSKHCHRSYKIGDVISMELMTREKGSLYVTKADEIRNNSDGQFPNFSDGDDHFTYSKLIMADPKEILKIIEQERNELEFQLIEDGDNCPESIFVQQAMDLLNIKQRELEVSIREKAAADNTSSLLNPSVAAFVPAQKHEVVEDSAESHEARNEEFIDEECNLTVNDIDIIPAATCQSKHFYYYQAPNAQNVFLHSINSRMLQHTFESLDKSPQTIHGKIVQIECCTMNEDLRKRLKYLQHLPVSSVFEVVEIEFDAGFVSHDVVDMFKDELYHRRKIRQRRDRDERKREKVINEINDRQMGKMMKAASANINIDSTSQFPQCGSFTELPTLTSNFSDHSISPTLASSPAGPSFATMLTTSKARKSEKLWPSLSIDGQPTTASASSFFGDKKLVHVTGNKSMMATPQPKEAEQDEDSNDEDIADCKVPAYKNQLGDCLANALAKSVNLKEAPKSSGKKKKAKKTLLFASGMNFN